MLNSVVRFVILSIIIIVVMHSLYSFLVKNLTIPMVKDLVHKPQTQYENILKSITENDQKKHYEKRETDGDHNYNSHSNTLSENQIEMKNELKSYINDLRSSRNQKQEATQHNRQNSPNSPNSSSVFDSYDIYNDYHTSTSTSTSSTTNNNEPVSMSSGGNYDQIMSLSQY